MESLNNALTWILEIAGVVFILLGAGFWIRVAMKGKSTARSFMALVFSFVFFIAVILRGDDFTERTLIWLAVVYGAILVVYITARMIEHREEIKGGRGSG